MSVFTFKHFQIHQKNSALKVGTDSMLLGALCNWENPLRLLDIGTGTGVLSLMCAQRFGFDEIIGVELSEEAFIDAQINAENNPFGSKISMLNQTIQTYHPELKFDAIISNPPFFENSLQNQNEHKSLARHTESLSFSELIQSISRLLTEDGKAWLIIPFENKDNMIQLAAKKGLFLCNHITLFGKPEKITRSILSFTKKSFEVQNSSFCIRTKNGTYTDEYKLLTKEFHDRILD